MADKPIYMQLSEQLIQYINKNLKAGDYLPSERKIAEQYQISRTTVRLALKQLEDLGYIVARPGKGSMVTDHYQRAINIGSMYSFTEHMKQLGRVPKTDIIDKRLIPVTKALQAILPVGDDEQVVYLYRQRLADGIPMMIEETYLPERLFPGFIDKALDKRSMYDVLREDYQTVVKQAEEEIVATLVTEKAARFLDIAPGSPVLEITRKTYSSKNDVIEYTKSIARADKFSYRMVHVNRN
ncbi:GntR family transcriptional regulator [Fundicoccus culcitae]|uniref:GntR family transcriptional regulator n=1 Tax=Fundicoccus culcitae TaxID=2969821 RepID=A0ABY5P8F6_9LACT|nr:GntR family transcriptional regulator [Fundicoccus culcitae]UUX34665.1 GntR family transcriptional regulator [Fundicoccus culcitae]